MTSQTTGAAPGSSSAWPVHAAGTMAYDDCAPLLSLADGAADVRVRRAPAGGCDGADRALGGPCAPKAAPVVPCPEPPPDLPRPPLRSARPTSRDVLRPAPRARAVIGRVFPASADHRTGPAFLAGQGGENR